MVLFACAVRPAALELHPDVRMSNSRGELEVRAFMACTRGDLEQVCCGRGTREHESLLVTDAPASAVQAGLIAIGLQAGRPGAWSVGASGALELQAPAGDPVELRVRWSEGGAAREAPIGAWIEDRRPAAGELAFVFAGSRFVDTPARQRFAADLSGSVVGLVTFGDEVIAPSQVEPDRVDVAAPRWRARSAALPPEGTPVTLVIRRSVAP